jgi:hypothetical protein
MRHRAEAAVVCRRFAKEAGPDLEALTRVLVARAVLGARVVLGVRVVRVTSADPVVLAVRATAVPVVPVVRATSADPVVLVVLVVRATSAGRVDLAGQATAAPVGRVALVVRATSAGRVAPAVPATSDRGLPTPSAVSVVPRGVMEQRRGAGENRRGPGGVGRSLLRAECGTKGRSTTGATTSNRYGIRAKMVGASTSSESGSRCNQPVG